MTRLGSRSLSSRLDGRLISEREHTQTKRHRKPKRPRAVNISHEIIQACTCAYMHMRAPAFAFVALSQLPHCAQAGAHSHMRGLWLQYVREITRQLIQLRLLQGIQSLRHVPSCYWRAAARADNPNRQEFVSVHAFLERRFVDATVCPQYRCPRQNLRSNLPMISSAQNKLPEQAGDTCTPCLLAARQLSAHARARHVCAHSPTCLCRPTNKSLRCRIL